MAIGGMGRKEPMDSESMSSGSRKTYKGKSLKPGGGGRFAKLKDKLKSEGKSDSAAAGIAAAAGRAKYGAKKFSKMAQAGRK